jgi:hypothetical protein
MIGNTPIAEVKEQSSFTTTVLEGNKYLPQRPPILFPGGNVMRRRHDDPIGIPLEVQPTHVAWHRFDPNHLPMCHSPRTAFTHLHHLPARFDDDPIIIVKTAVQHLVNGYNTSQ